MKLLANIENAFHHLADLVPANIKAVITGEIAKVNLTNPDASGDEKRGLVAEAVAELTGLAKGLAHALIHSLFVKAEASAPASIQPIAEVAEQVADTLVDKSVDTAAAKLRATPFSIESKPKLTTPGEIVAKAAAAGNA